VRGEILYVQEDLGPDVWNPSHREKLGRAKKKSCKKKTSLDDRDRDHSSAFSGE